MRDWTTCNLGRSKNVMAANLEVAKLFPVVLGGQENIEAEGLSDGIHIGQILK